MKFKRLLIASVIVALICSSSVFAFSDASPLLTDKNNYTELMDYFCSFDINGLKNALSKYPDDESVQKVMDAISKYDIPYDQLVAGLDPSWGNDICYMKGFDEVTDTVHVYASHDFLVEKLKLTIGFIGKDWIYNNWVFLRGANEALYDGIVMDNASYGSNNTPLDDGRIMESRSDYIYSNTVDYLYELEPPVSIRFFNDQSQATVEVEVNEEEWHALQGMMAYEKLYHELSTIRVYYELQAKAAEEAEEAAKEAEKKAKEAEEAVDAIPTYNYYYY